MYSENGVKHLSVAQLANIATAVSVKEPGAFFAFRVLCAYLACQARKEATERSLRKAKRYVKEGMSVTKTEIRALVGGDKSIEEAFRFLEARGVLTRVSGGVTLTETPLPGSEPLLETLCGKDAFGLKRSIARPIPVPRAWLERWASPSRAPIQQLLHFVYSSVLCYKNKTGGAIKSIGAFKFSRLAAALSINERSLWSARAALIRDEKISEDQTYSQKVLNRRGHYVVVNLEWGKENQPVDNSSRLEPSLQAKEEKPTSSAGPIRDIKHLTVSRDQKASPPSGVCKQKKEAEPNLRDIQPNDLRRASRLESLHRQAVDAELIDGSEASVLKFLGAALRAREVDPDNPDSGPRIFMWTLQSQSFHHITQAQEERARTRLKQWREYDPGFMRCGPSQNLSVNTRKCIEDAKAERVGEAPSAAGALLDRLGIQIHSRRVGEKRGLSPFPSPGNGDQRPAGGSPAALVLVKS